MSKIADENRTKLGELIGTVGAKLLYEYDFGDGWQHELLLEEVLLGDGSFQQMCVAGKRCCPPEDCGGPQGFAEMLNALQDANDPSHEEVCEWLGNFVPESFSAGVGNIEPDTSRALHPKTTRRPGSNLRSTVPGAN